MEVSIVKSWLRLLNFKAKEGKNNLYYKMYSNNSKELTIKIDEVNFFQSKINYKDFGIEVCRDTTSNFSQEENLVVLECVDRLLTKGYQAENIVLEKDWDLGHKGKGYCDIAIFNNEKKKKKKNVYFLLNAKHMNMNLKKKNQICRGVEVNYFPICNRNQMQKPFASILLK